VNQRAFKIIVISIVCVISSIACSSGDVQKNTSPVNLAASPAPTPAKAFTVTDVARLKWIEGTWRGLDGDKPFYERYTLEETAMVVESLKEDGSPDGEPGRFELKDGEFGKGEGDKRSAASEITGDYIQFVSAVPGKGNDYRFARQVDGTWHAILEWSATAERPAGRKIYRMEPWQPKTK
jgi:hypothetical protein